ncbi:unnamed protein product [Mesocestoides corti]|uniref:Secreted protein n=1 Tax=Mesocestoides corti TaxID=53468 RepID=A0A0R3UBV7_MESCO|nr:unnamed protein product [Mesocestoides corti]
MVWLFGASRLEEVTTQTILPSFESYRVTAILLHRPTQGPVSVSSFNLGFTLYARLYQPGFVLQLSPKLNHVSSLATITAGRRPIPGRCLTSGR